MTDGGQHVLHIIPIGESTFKTNTQIVVVDISCIANFVEKILHLLLTTERPWLDESVNINFRRAYRMVDRMEKGKYQLVGQQDADLIGREG